MTARRFRTFARRGGVLFALLLVVLFGVRIYLPTAIREYVNRTLDRIPEYDGQVGDVDLHLWRGAYSIQDIKLVKTTGAVPVPLYESQNVQFTIEWRALLEGKVVGEIEIDRPKVNFVKGRNAGDSQVKVDGEFLQAVKDLYPLRLNGFTARNGEVRYRDFNSDPRIDVLLTEVFLYGADFSNTRKPAEGVTAKLRGEGMLEKTAVVRANSQFEPSAKEPTFNLDFSLRKLPLRSMNDIIRAYAAFDVESGVLSLDAELAASEKRFRGYIKPIMQDVKILSLREDSKNPIRLVWEGFVGLFSEIFENQRHEQIATRIPFSGSFDNPKANNWETVLNTVYNAFVEAYKPGFENSIDIKDVK